MYIVGRDSDSLRAIRWKWDFPPPSRPALSPTQPPSTLGTGSFAGVKRAGHGLNHLPQSSAEVKERIQLYVCSPSVPSWQVVGWALPPTSTLMYVYVGFKTSFYVVRHLDSIASYLPTGLLLPTGTYVCLYIYIYIYKHTYIYIYIYIYTLHTNFCIGKL